MTYRVQLYIQCSVSHHIHQYKCSVFGMSYMQMLAERLLVHIVHSAKLEHI